MKRIIIKISVVIMVLTATLGISNWNVEASGWELLTELKENTNHGDVVLTYKNAFSYSLSEQYDNENITSILYYLTMYDQDGNAITSSARKNGIPGKYDSQKYNYKANVEITNINFGRVWYTVKIYRSEKILPGDLTITTLSTVKGGETLKINWSKSENATRYYLQRRIDNGEWLQVYTGTDLTFTDTITKGWNTVTYRVRAYNEDGYSSYATSNIVTVINNVDPVLTINEITGDSFSEVNKHNIIEIKGNVKDENIGDNLVVKYTLGNLEGHTNKTIYTAKATGNLQEISHEIKIDNSISEGTYMLYVWAEDGNGGKSKEYRWGMIIDKTKPNIKVLIR